MSKGKKPEVDLFGADDDADNNFGIAINTQYADRYNNWRGKEEMQKLKDKYGDVGINESDESTSESEDEDAQELTKDVELEFFRTLSLLKSKDKKIYDKEKTRFFENMVGHEDSDGEENGKTKKTSSKEKKPYQLKDLEREMIMEKMKKVENGLNIDEDDEYENSAEGKKDARLKNLSTKKSYFEEQEDLKKNLKKAIGDDSAGEEEEDAFLQVKTKSKEQKDKEDQDYIDWLKGRKETIKDAKLKENMESLHDYWTDPNLSDGEKFLRDYILNKRYIDNEEENSDEEEAVGKEKVKMVGDPKAPSMESSQPLDFVEFSDEEKIIENQEEFERKYNFRFEDPDPEFIKAYPRTIVDSMRRDKSKRKEKREEYKQRKELEKLKKKEEIKRLKSLKRTEIMNKIDKLKKISGKQNLQLNEDDFEKDFEPDEYEKRMRELFDDDYYEAENAENDENEDDKPVFTDDEAEDDKYIDWDEWDKEETERQRKSKKESKKDKKKKKKAKEEEDEVDDPDFDMDCEPEAEQETKTGKKQSKLAKALLKKKPVFDPKEKTFEEYFDEYYQLDCEDVIGGDTPCRFKYREVMPNDFGLNLEEIFGCKDTELNQWASLKKAVQYRPISEEISDVKVYKSKKNHLDLKKKILRSLYQPSDEESDHNEAQAQNTDEKPVESEPPKKKSKNNKKETEEPVAEPESPKKKSKKNKKEPEPEPVVTKERNETKSGETKHKPTKEDKTKKNKPKKKNKNILESMSTDRLLAYGIEPKKFHKKLKYAGTEDKKN